MNYILDNNDYPVRTGSYQSFRNEPRCYFNKSSSSNPQTANNAQGSAEQGSIGLGGNNSNTSTAITYNVTNADADVVNNAINSVASVSNSALLSNNVATANALAAGAEATHGVVSIAGQAINAVSSANTNAQNFVNENTALAFDTIDKLTTGSTDALTYEAATLPGSSALATSANGNAPADPGNFAYVGPSNSAPAIGDNGADKTATYITIIAGAIAIWYYFRTGRA